MTNRKYFKTQFDAEQWLRDQGFLPTEFPLFDGQFTCNWMTTDGLIGAEIRFNAQGYFIVERA